LEKEKGDPFGKNEPLLRKDTRKLVPIEYYDFLNIFNKVDSNILPPRREGVDYRINLEFKTRLKDLYYNLLYKILLEKLKVCREYVLNNFQKGFIVFSNAL